MADTKISGLTSATPADADYVAGVDVSDTTQSPGGSTARYFFSAIWSYISGKLGVVATGAATGASILAKTATGAGAWAELVSSDNTVLRKVTGNLSFGKLNKEHLNANIADNTILAQMATQTIKGRTTAATGNAEDLTMAQVVAMIDTQLGGTAWRTSSGAVTVGSGAPAAAPGSVGLLYVDTNGYDFYFSTGTATVSDWRKVIDNTDGGAISAKVTPVLADTVFQFDSAAGDAPVISTWTQIIAALKLVTLDANGRLVNPKATYTSYDGGAVSTGTYTPTSVDGNMQHYTNNGAHTLAPPANPGSFLIEIANGATAGAITTSGFTKVSGDAFTTTNGHKFQCSITRTNSTSHLNVKAMQ